MRSIESRLARLAREVQTRTVGCPTCAGGRPVALRVRFAEDPPSEPVACPDCGKPGEVLQIVIGGAETNRTAVMPVR